MPLCRSLIAEALRALKAIAPGDDPEVDELTTGMEAISDLILDIHEARGPMTDVDVSGAGPYVASENQRVRIQAGSSLSVTLPNAIPIFSTPDPYDYGFSAPTVQPPQGSTGVADGYSFRQPRDGTRIEVVGTTQGLWFYRADLNQWMVGVGLTLDSEMPFNARYASAMGALVAERMMETLPFFDEPSPGLARRVAAGKSALLLRMGTARDAVRAQYF